MMMFIASQGLIYWCESCKMIIVRYTSPSHHCSLAERRSVLCEVNSDVGLHPRPNSKSIDEKISTMQTLVIISFQTLPSPLNFRVRLYVESIDLLNISLFYGLRLHKKNSKLNECPKFLARLVLIRFHQTSSLSSFFSSSF